MLFKSILRALLICRACRGPIDSIQNPDHPLRSLCQPCARALWTHPKTDSLADPLGVDTLTSFYEISNPQASRVLNLWKRTPGMDLDAVIRNQIQSWLEAQPKTHPLWSTDCIVCVPQHPARVLELGRNPAAELAGWLGEKTRTNFETLTWHGARHRGQTTKNREKRLEHRILFRRPLTREGKSSFSAKRVLVVDDFWTTGSTLKSVARSLRAWGAIEIHAFVLARRRIPDVVVPAFIQAQTDRLGRLEGGCARAIAIG